MNIYYIRHGQTDFNLKKRVQGCIDIELNNTGIEQAKMAKKNLKNIEFDAVYASPLTRTKQTAYYALGNRNYELNLDYRIAERDYGMYEGLSYDVLEYSKLDFKKTYTIDTYTKNGVETLESMKTRIRNFFNEISKKDYKNVLIVSHGGIGRVIFSELTNKPMQEVYDMYIENCSIIKYEV